MTTPPRRWTSLPPPAEGVLWMAFACVCWVSNTLIVRPVTDEIAPIQMMFVRLAISLAVMLPFVWHLGWSALRIQRKGLYAIRAALMFTSMLAWIYSIKLLPIADAVALAFTAPLFATIMAALFLRERVGIRRWSAVVVGFVGALVILRPGVGLFDPNSFFVLLNAATWAGAVIVIRVLTRTENPTVMVLYTFILLTPMSAVPVFFVWQEPSLECWLLLATVAVTGVLGHLASTRALSLADTAVVIPVEYLQLPLNAIFAYMLFGEVPSIYVPIGATIIVSAVLYISHRESVRAKEAARTPLPKVPHGS